MIIKLTYPDSEFVVRQTSGSTGGWRGDSFHINEAIDRCDAWVVFERLSSVDHTVCPPERTLFITAEPAVVRGYDPRFLAQFGAVLTPQNVPHPRVIQSQPAIPWWAGIVVQYPHKQRYTLDYDRFRSMPVSPKTGLISLITTSKQMTDAHRARLKFVERLIGHFGDRLDVFGQGFRPIADKWDALHSYRYSIVLENCRCDHYWTEKLADAFLARAFPIYCGCPNVGHYFPAGALCEINRDEPDAAIATIERVLADNRFEQALPALEEARNLVLERYNLFPTVVEVLRNLPAGEPRRVQLHPEADFTDPLLVKVRRKLRGMVRGHA
jgi:hypothetical protein